MEFRWEAANCDLDLFFYLYTLVALVVYVEQKTA